MSEHSSLYPIFLDLAGRSAVVIGGGDVGARKAQSLIHCGARVTIVAPQCTPEIERRAAEGALTVKRRAYETSDIEGATLVIAATNVAGVNARIAEDCRRNGILVNVIDESVLCDFLVPAVVEQGSIQIAVSTGGRSPALARVVKRTIEAAIGPEFAELNDILGSLRDAAKSSPKLPTDTDRKQFFEDLLNCGILDMLREGRREEAYESIAALCTARDVRLSAFVHKA